MKLKYIIYVAIAIIVTAAVCVGVWYCSPKIFLDKITDEDISSISVFNGNTGTSFEIKSADEISEISNNLRNAEMKRDGISLNYDGYAFSLTFKDKNGNILDSFILNSEDTIRDDPFFYRCSDGKLCYDLLTELEEKYAENN